MTATTTNLPTKDFLEFLMTAELQHYHNGFLTNLKVNNVSQLKYVEDDDLTSIGMSKPEIRRLRQHFKKEYPKGALTKIKKILSKNQTDASNSSSSTISISPPINLTNSSPMKHIIPEESVMLLKVIGRGEFGCVQQGVWSKENGDKLQVAIKCLPRDQVKGQTSEFLEEANIMHSICHPHIVTLHGVVLGEDNFMMVTELAPLKSLLECLKDPTMRSIFTLQHLYDLANQLADAMEYLERNRLIHRDLAARNVLMFARDQVKISDFGLSRALGVGSDYYQGHLNTGLKLPIAWCAPECINFLKFTTASDAWSFGVLLWEMFSGGAQPWEGMTGLEIMQSVDAPNLERLPCPMKSSDEMYNLMLQCWMHEPTDRPKFHDIHANISQMKAIQVIMLKDTPVDGSMNDDYLRYKSQSIVTVLSKNPPNPPQPNLWRGMLDSTSSVGYFDPRCSSPYIEVVPSNQLLRKIKLNRTESARLSMRNQYKATPNLISNPQNDLRHLGHVGYDGVIFGDVSFIGNNYDKLPLKVSSTHRSEDDLRSSRMSLPQNQMPLPKKQSGFSVSSSTLMGTTTEQHDEFDDFTLPNFSTDFDSGSSLMDEVLKMLSTTTTVAEDDEMKDLLAGFENLGLSVYLNQNGSGTGSKPAAVSAAGKATAADGGGGGGGGGEKGGVRVGGNEPKEMAKGCALVGKSMVHTNGNFGDVKTSEFKCGYEQGGGGGSGGGSNSNSSFGRVGGKLNVDDGSENYDDDTDVRVHSKISSNGYNNNISNIQTTMTTAKPSSTITTTTTSATTSPSFINRYNNKPINTSSPNSVKSTDYYETKKPTNDYNVTSSSSSPASTINNINNINNYASPIHNNNNNYNNNNVDHRDDDDEEDEHHNNNNNDDDDDDDDDDDNVEEGSMFESSSGSSNRDLNGHYNGLDDDKKSKISGSSIEHQQQLHQQQQQQQQRSQQLQNDNKTMTTTTTYFNKSLDSHVQISTKDEKQQIVSSPRSLDPSFPAHQPKKSTEYLNLSPSSDQQPQQPPQQQQQRTSLRSINITGPVRSSITSSSSSSTSSHQQQQQQQQQLQHQQPSSIPTSASSRNQNLRAPIIPGRPAPLASTDDDVDSSSVDTNPLRRLRQSGGARPMMTFRTINNAR